MIKSIAILALMLVITGCASNNRLVKSNNYCLDVADKAEKNSAVTAIDAYNTCIDMKDSERMRSLSGGEKVVDLGVKLVLDILTN